HYKNTKRISDITIGDYWRIEDNDKDFDDDKGVSLVMINTAKGRAYFDKCKKDLIVNEYPLSRSIQPALSKNYPKPKNRAAFWQEYKPDNVMELVNKYTASPLPTKRQKINSILFKILRIAKVIK
ncbi:MAG: Coenzyme F420 hydrogenase/dehydrogenase, beta subunit C-terminal domain, partial [Eubacterium sp.]|nr:Coenzyme F420 hydrogenase/dehydrogenase, beta subunit C-terminal domain [Eubacterium sp.]